MGSTSNAVNAQLAAASAYGSGAGTSSTTASHSVYGSSNSSMQSQKARFRVKISDLTLAFPSYAQPHPAHVSFNFDSFWSAESTKTQRPANPANTHHPLRFASYVDARASDQQQRPISPAAPEIRFIYETSLGSKLHRKFLVLTLHLPTGTAPTAIVSIDAIARGCHRIALTFPDPLDKSASPVATAYFRVTMLNFARVQVQVSDLKVVDYPEKHIHDQKLLYLELGYQPFVEGYIHKTDRSSDAEPMFPTGPILERLCSLQEMLHGGAEPSDLCVYFSLHRQVALARSAEIGLGALPVHMLFAKVVNGRMEAPTKFKVPLAGYKGQVKGRIILRNIPQWSQLGGDDLINRDGVIHPTSVDLHMRKLLPWLALPRVTTSSQRASTAPSTYVRPYSSPVAPPLQSTGASMGSLSENSDSNSFGRINPPPSAKWPEGGGVSFAVAGGNTLGQPHAGQGAPLPPPPPPPPLPSLRANLPSSGGGGGDGGLEQSAAAPPPPPPPPPPPRSIDMSLVTQSVASHGVPPSPSVPEHRRGSSVDYYPEVASHLYTAPPDAVPPSPDHVYQGLYGEPSDGRPVDGYGSAYSAANVPYSPPSEVPQLQRSYTDDEAREREQQYQREYQRQTEAARARQNYSYAQHQVPGHHSFAGGADQPHVEPVPSVGGGRSGKSIGSANTNAHDAAHSNASDEDATTGTVPAPQGPDMAGAEPHDPISTPADSDALATESADSSQLGGQGMHEPVDSWIEVQYDDSDRYYYANPATNESLWLPPMWERLVDADGRHFFVDHGNETTQREFPAAEARAYKEKVHG